MNDDVAAVAASDYNDDDDVDICLKRVAIVKYKYFFTTCLTLCYLFNLFCFLLYFSLSFVECVCVLDV